MTENKNLNQFFDAMWKDYCNLNPQALAVFKALSEAGEKVVNDHIAFRTFSHPKISIPVLSRHFTKYGYKPIGDYQFREKKLKARHFEHADPLMPKVFISELDLSQMSPQVSEIVDRLVAEIPDAWLEPESFVYAGRPWKSSFEIYKKLSLESEYAAWVYAHGFRPNHFTVYINHLKKLNDIRQLNSFLKEHGFPLNSSGGEVKGTPADFLEQSSTMANEIPVTFQEGVFNVPACYYEFAKRYPQPDGHLFQGFVAGSADKIFESTNQLKGL